MAFAPLEGCWGHWGLFRLTSGPTRLTVDSTPIESLVHLSPKALRREALHHRPRLGNACAAFLNASQQEECQIKRLLRDLGRAGRKSSDGLGFRAVRPPDVVVMLWLL